MIEDGFFNNIPIDGFPTKTTLQKTDSVACVVNLYLLYPFLRIEDVISPLSRQTSSSVSVDCTFHRKWVPFLYVINRSCVLPISFFTHFQFNITDITIINFSNLESMKLNNNANLQKFKSKKRKKGKNQQTKLNMNMTVCFLVWEGNRKGNCCGGSGCKASERKEVAVTINKADQALLHFPWHVHFSCT